MRQTTLALAAATFALAAPAAVAQELKLADFQPPTHFIVSAAYEPFAEAVSLASDGDVTVTIYMGGELGAGPLEQYTRTVEGATDLAFGLPGYTASNFPRTLLLELPGVITAETGTERILANIDMLSEEYRRVVLVGLWNNAPNLLLMSEQPVRSLEDLQGLNIRVPSRNAGLVVEAWGATPVSMPAPAIYNAMQTGVIDGAMIDATTLRAFRLEEVTQYVTTGMDTTISLFFLIMNRDAFEELSDEEQAAVLTAGRDASRNANAAWLAAADGALTAFAATDGKEVIELSPEAAAEFNAASAAAVEGIVSQADADGLEATAFIEALQAE